MPELTLPPSLATVPNIPLHRQTISQLRAERDYWQAKLDSLPCWGAAVAAAAEFLKACDTELSRRPTE
jgi:hypothetical protein